MHSYQRVCAAAGQEGVREVTGWVSLWQQLPRKIPYAVVPAPQFHLYQAAPKPAKKPSGHLESSMIEERLKVKVVYFGRRELGPGFGKAKKNVWTCVYQFTPAVTLKKKY